MISTKTNDITDNNYILPYLNFASIFSALDIVLTVEPCRNTIEELIVEKFLRTSSVVLDSVTLLICHNQLKRM